MMIALLALLGFSTPFTLTQQTSPVDASLRGIYAFSPQVVWASGANGTVLGTRDGGVTWNKFKILGGDRLDFRDIHVISEDVIIVQSAGPGGSSRMFRSTNGGKSWSQVFVNPHPTGFFDGMDFWDGKRGVAYSDPVGGRFFLVATEDAGLTWRRLDNLPEAFNGEASFAASGTGIATMKGGHLWFGSGGAVPVARIFRSSDYGASWDVVTSPLRNDTNSAGCFSITFWSPTEGCAVGGNYEALWDPKQNCVITTDGGKTWRSAKKPPAGYRSVVAHTQTKNGLVLVTAGPGGIDISKDKGNTWTQIAKKGYHTLSFAPDSNVGWFAGSQGKITKITLE